MAIASRSAAGGNLDIPEGYHGNLNPHQQKALDDLKKMLESKHGIVSEASPVATRHQVEIYADPELRYDLELLRFLRARRFDLAKSYGMYMAARDWRDKEDLDTLYASFDYARAQQAFRQHYPSYIHKTDLSGSPVHIHEISKIDLDGLLRNLSSEEAIQYLFLLSESNLRERFPASTLRLRQEDTDSTAIIETVTAIFDLKGIGIRGFWRAKDMLYRLIQISDNYYPETANKLFVINAPGVFSTIWSYLKGWLDARTAARVFVLGSGYQETLLKHIDPQALPSHLGGTCHCEDKQHGCRNGDVGPWTSNSTK
ncbi:CRAL/TRIO domain-containing protein [Cystobasidium minutum MCA 4210]|uniref:CRAL/TRIO domain-containing protein n=1 Tax=Cystobasidium minutum MCA 4210 TaxID=1397322 RepID=UPI0034CF2931|eukprot:jgi/Rhomi1/10453/CE10452_669